MKPTLSKQNDRANKRPNHQSRLAQKSLRYAVTYMDHAPVWQALIFATGIFRPTQNGARAKAYEVRFKSKIQDHQMEYVVRSPEALNITDQTVYFHLCQLIASGKHIQIDASHDRYSTYQKVLGASGMWADTRLGVVKIKLSDLAAGIGLTRTGTNGKAMLASLNRLSQATFERSSVDGGSVIDEGVSQFLGFLCFDTEVRIVMHFESNFHAEKRKGVAWIDMREQRSLHSKPAKRLHAWLTAWGSSIERKLVALDKLVVSVWGAVPATSDVRKDRARTLRKAVQEVGNPPGWTCSLTEDGRQLLVRKPLFAGTAMAEELTPRPAAKGPLRAALTPTKAAATLTEAAGTATDIAATATTNSLKTAPSLDSDELVFAL